MAKQKPYIIKGRDPTEEEMRKELGLSKKNVEILKKLADTVLGLGKNKRRKTKKKTKK